MKYNPKIHHRRSVRLKGYDYAKEGLYFITICTHNRIHFFGAVEDGKMVLSPFGEIAHQEWEKLPDRWPHIELGAFQIMPNHMHGVLLIQRPFSEGEGMELLEGVGDMDRGDAGPVNMNRMATDRGYAGMVDTDHMATNRAATRAAPTIDSANHRNGTVGATLVVAPDMVAPDMVAPDMVAPNIVAPDNMTTPSNPSPPPETPFSKLQWATRPYLGQIMGAYKSIVSTACLDYHKTNQPGVWLDKIWQRGFDDRIIRDVVAFKNITKYIINNPANWRTDKFFD